MIALLAAALTGSAVTLVLNAQYGYATSADPLFAYLMAALSVSFDLAKSASVVAASKAWRAGAWGVATLCVLVFAMTLAYSLNAGVSQITRDRTAAASVQAATHTRHTLAADEHRRLTADLALMERNPTYAATSACALPKSNEAKSFCSTVAATRARLATIVPEVGAAVADPTPHITLFSQFTGLSIPHLTFALALWPVLLAELTGSVGFYLAARLRAPAPQPAPEEPRMPRSRFWLAWSRPTSENPSEARLSGRSGIVSRTPHASAPDTPTLPPKPTIQWGAPSPRNPA